jgi:hypothetical protein
MNIEKEDINPWILNQKRLLDELAIDIANKFWMDKQKAIDLLKTDISKWLQELKNEIQRWDNEKLKNLPRKELEKLFFTLKGALEVIEKISKNEIQILKEDIEKNINIEDFINNIEDYLPPNLIKKAKDPKNIHEHILWFALWTTNSILKTVEILFLIWKWILQTPYHLYMIITWKWESNSFKDI